MAKKTFWERYPSLNQENDDEYDIDAAHKINIIGSAYMHLKNQ